jgi:hypothetical protein
MGAAMKLTGASVLCLLCWLGGLQVSGLCSARAQEEKPDEAVVATLVKLVKDREQELARRLKACDKLAELKVKDKEAVKAVANLLEEVWPEKDIPGQRKKWEIASFRLANDIRKDKVEYTRLLQQADLLTQRVDALGRNLAAMGAAETAEPTMRKALALQQAQVVGTNFTGDKVLDSVNADIKPLRLNALKYLVQLRTPTAIAAISDEILDADIGPQAIEAVGKLKVTEAVPKLTDVLLKSKEKAHRRAAAVALGAIGSAKGLTALKAAEAVEEDKECLSAIRAAIKLLESGGK